MEKGNLSRRGFMKQSVIINATKMSARLDTVNGPVVLHPIEEAPGVSANAVAQWRLTAMAMLDLAGNAYNK